MTHLALAAISARPLAEAAAREGFKAIALDLFGDHDTCSAASEWLPIGAPEALRIDATKLLDALSTLARRGDVQGWVAGAGFDGQSELLAQGAARLPLIGTAPADQRRVRDPATFFGFSEGLRLRLSAGAPPRCDAGRRLAGEGRRWLRRLAHRAR